MKNETRLDSAAIASECARYITADGPLAVSMAEGIRRGDLELVSRVLEQDAGMATVRVGEANKSKTWLHVVTDWPGYFPNGPAVVRALIEAGADPNATIGGAWHSETPLHWAASSDDVEVAEALIIGGANVEAKGGSIAGGTPLDNAIGYGCWRVARLLAGRGAQIEKLWHAAALGMRSHVESFVDRE